MTASTRRRWYNPYSVLKSVLLRPRLYLAVLAGLAVMLLLPRSAAGHIREAASWIVGSVVYLAMVSHTMWACSPQNIAKQAEREDESRMVIMVLVLLAIGSSFASIVGLLNEAKAAGQTKWIYLLLAGTTTVVSWAVTQFVFTLHYAHEYYRPDTGQDQKTDWISPARKIPTTGISYTSQRPSALPRKPLTSPSRHAVCDVWLPYMQSYRSFSTRPCWH